MLVAVSSATVPATATAPVVVFRVTLVALTVAAWTGSLNEAFTAAVAATPVAPLAGTEPVTVGATVSVP